MAELARARCRTDLEPHRPTHSLIRASLSFVRATRTMGAADIMRARQAPPAKQRGATFLGMVIIFAILGFGVYAGIRLVPIYFEYMAVVRAMDQVAKEYD